MSNRSVSTSSVHIVGRLPDASAARITTDWLSMPRTWMERLEPRRHLSRTTYDLVAVSDGYQMHPFVHLAVDAKGDIRATDENGEELATYDVEVDGAIYVSDMELDVHVAQSPSGAFELADGRSPVDWTDLDDYGVLPHEAGAVTLMVADALPGRQVELSLDTDGTVTGRDTDDIYCDVYTNYDGSIHTNLSVLPAPVAIDRDGEYTLVPGFVANPASSNTVFGYLNSDASGTPTLDVADGAPDRPLLHLSVDVAGNVSATDSQNVRLDQYACTAGSDGHIEVDGYLFAAHVTLDDHGAFALASGYPPDMSPEEIADATRRPTDHRYGELQTDVVLAQVELTIPSKYHASITLSVDAAGTVVAIDEDGKALGERFMSGAATYVARDGTVIVDFEVLAAHVVLNANGNYGLAAGALPDAEANWGRYRVATDPAGTATFTLDDQTRPSNQRRALYFSIDTWGEVTCADAAGETANVWTDSDGTIELYSNLAFENGYVGVHVVKDADGEYALAGGYLPGTVRNSTSDEDWGDLGWGDLQWSLRHFTSTQSFFADRTAPPTLDVVNAFATDAVAPVAVAAVDRPSLADNVVEGVSGTPAGDVIGQRRDGPLPARKRQHDDAAATDILATV